MTSSGTRKRPKVRVSGEHRLVRSRIRSRRKEGRGNQGWAQCGIGRDEVATRRWASSDGTTASIPYSAGTTLPKRWLHEMCRPAVCRGGVWQVGAVPNVARSTRSRDSGLGTCSLQYLGCWGGVGRTRSRVRISHQAWFYGAEDAGGGRAVIQSMGKAGWRGCGWELRERDGSRWSDLGFSLPSVQRWMVRLEPGPLLILREDWKTEGWLATRQVTDSGVWICSGGGATWWPWPGTRQECPFSWGDARLESSPGR
jgi:hypothetical protein